MTDAVAERLYDSFRRALAVCAALAASSFFVLPFSGEFGWLGGAAAAGAVGYVFGMAHASLKVLFVRPREAGGEP